MHPSHRISSSQPEPPPVTGTITRINSLAYENKVDPRVRKKWGAGMSKIKAAAAPTMFLNELVKAGEREKLRRSRETTPIAENVVEEDEDEADSRPSATNSSRDSTASVSQSRHSSTSSRAGSRWKVPRKSPLLSNISLQSHEPESPTSSVLPDSPRLHVISDNEREQDHESVQNMSIPRGKTSLETLPENTCIETQIIENPIQVTNHKLKKEDYKFNPEFFDQIHVHGKQSLTPIITKTTPTRSPSPEEKNSSTSNSPKNFNTNSRSSTGNEQKTPSKTCGRQGETSESSTNHVQTTVNQEVPGQKPKTSILKKNSNSTDSKRESTTNYTHSKSNNTESNSKIVVNNREDPTDSSKHKPKNSQVSMKSQNSATDGVKYLNNPEVTNCTYLENIKDFLTINKFTDLPRTDKEDLLRLGLKSIYKDYEFYVPIFRTVSFEELQEYGLCTKTHFQKYQKFLNENFYINSKKFFKQFSLYLVVLLIIYDIMYFYQLKEGHRLFTMLSEIQTKQNQNSQSTNTVKTQNILNQSNANSNTDSLMLMTTTSASFISSNLIIKSIYLMLLIVNIINFKNVIKLFKIKNKSNKDQSLDSSTSPSNRSNNSNTKKGGSKDDKENGSLVSDSKRNNNDSTGISSIFNCKFDFNQMVFSILKCHKLSAMMVVLLLLLLVKV